MPGDDRPDFIPAQPAQTQGARPDFIPHSTPTASTPHPSGMGGAGGSWAPTQLSEVQNWGDVSVGNPFEGGIGAMAKRTGSYLGGELAGVGEAASGMMHGLMRIPQIAEDTIRGALGDPKHADAAVQSYKDMAQGFFDMGTAPFKARTYTNPKAFGNEVFNVAATLYAPEKAAGLPEDLAVRMKAIKPKQQLLAQGAKRLAEAQVESQKLLETGEKAYDSVIGAKTRNIIAVDNAMGNPIHGQPVMDALLQKAGGLNADSRLRLPKVATVEDVIQKTLDSVPNGNLNFQRLQQLRSDIGRVTFTHDIPPMEFQINEAAYKKATDLMKDRAGQLNMSDEFNAYNREHHALQELRKSTLSELKSFDPLSTGFFKKVGNVGDVRVQNMLDKFNEATERPGVRGSGVGDAIRRISDETKPFQRILSQGEGAGLMGRIKAVMTHPLYGGVGALLGMAPGRLVGMPWIGGMIGATEGAALADKLNLAEALVKGSRYPAGEAAIKAGDVEGMIPSQLQPGARAPFPTPRQAGQPLAPTTPPSQVAGNMPAQPRGSAVATGDASLFSNPQVMKALVDRLVDARMSRGIQDSYTKAQEGMGPNPKGKPK